MQTQPKIAIVTGAGTGIGRACSVALAKAGFAVVLAGRRIEPLQDVQKSIEAAGGTAMSQTCDVADDAQVRALFDATDARFGRLDFLFNNAGLFSPNMPLEDLEVERWRSIVDVNLTGAFLCTQAAFRLMKAQSPRGGRIVNNGSISAHAPRPNSAPYTSTKHAITGLTKATSLDGRKYDIACGQIDIGTAETDLTGRKKTGVPHPDGSVRPEPLMDLDHVARAIFYMATLPLDANVQFMTVMATKMPFVGRG